MAAVVVEVCDRVAAATCRKRRGAQRRGTSRLWWWRCDPDERGERVVDGEAPSGVPDPGEHGGGPDDSGVGDQTEESGGGVELKRFANLGSSSPTWALSCSMEWSGSRVTTARIGLDPARPGVRL